jgi:N-acylethanolamine-hydrolysing acid amidase
MKNPIIICLLIFCALANVHPHPEPIISHVPKTYKVNADDPPLTRWAPIIKDFKGALDKFMYFFDLVPFPKTFFKDVDWYAHNEFKYQDFVAEVDAISKLSGHDFERVFFLNFMYEYSTIKACSGVIVRTQEGKIIHGRNLDFNFWELLANMTANIQYYRGGQLLYSVDTIVGSVFTLTANKPGAFSVEVNTRTEAHFQDDFINLLAKNAIPTCWLLRQVVDKETSYASAVQRLKTERIGGPVYFVVSGLKGN